MIVSRAMKLEKAAANVRAAALLLRTISDYPDCACDLAAQADYLDAEAAVEREKSAFNKWPPC